MNTAGDEAAVWLTGTGLYPVIAALITAIFVTLAVLVIGAVFATSLLRDGDGDDTASTTLVLS